MDQETARTMCSIFGRYIQSDQFGKPLQNLAEHLKEIFPQHHWRVILNRSGQYSRWALTIDDNDQREHYVPVGGKCVHCNKSAKELGVEEREE